MLQSKFIHDTASSFICHVSAFSQTSQNLAPHSQLEHAYMYMQL